MVGLKLEVNYATGFPAKLVAAALSRYRQILWVLSETVAEGGTMNVFAVFEHPDGGKILSSLPPGGMLCRYTTASCEGRDKRYCVSILFHSTMMHDGGNKFSSAPGTLTIDLYRPGHPIVHCQLP